MLCVMRVKRLLLVPGIREKISRFRFYYFMRFRGLVDAGDLSFVKRHQYSKSHFSTYSSIRERVDFLVSMLGMTSRLNDESKLLVLGPRYESEIFGYIGLGIKKKNIQAIDTFSYSKLITPGNLHNMPYGSEIFDIVVAGWTLAYSDSLETALLEIHRVLKSNGILIMTFDLREGEGFNTLSEVEIANHDASLLSIITPYFKVKNWFIGNTSWTQQNICCLAIEKI